jgi:hypothetical protein
MSSRTVSVVLKAEIANYKSNMRAAQLEALEVAKASKTATEQLKSHHEAMTKVGIGMAAVGATAAAGIAIAVKAAADYGAKMAQLQSLSKASAGDMQKLSDAAMKQGAAFGYSATQVADAQIELSKAGVSTADILGGALSGALALAAAGQMDVADATSVAVTAMTDFKLKASDIPHVADLLAAGADNSTASVASIGCGRPHTSRTVEHSGSSVATSDTASEHWVRHAKHVHAHAGRDCAAHDTRGVQQVAEVRFKRS